FLAFPEGIPSADTFGRVFEPINPKVFEGCFRRWVESRVQAPGAQVIPIDGKTLKGSYDREQGKSALHLVSAWSSEHRQNLRCAYPEPGIGSSLSSIGTIHASMSNYPQALKYYNQLLQIFQKLSADFVPARKLKPGKIDSREGKGTALNNLGELHDTLGQYKQAIHFYQQALEVYQDIQEKEGIGVALNNIASVYVAQGNYTE
ncbi:MAG: ISAs1 family transposase, partial [Richelia sp.]|nr:ISAs1 family transposase [Richelia sp.]